MRQGFILFDAHRVPVCFVFCRIYSNPFYCGIPKHVHYTQLSYLITTVLYHKQVGQLTQLIDDQTDACVK